MKTLTFQLLPIKYIMLTKNVFMSKSLDKMKKIWYNIPDGFYENVFIFSGERLIYVAQNKISANLAISDGCKVILPTPIHLFAP